MAHDSYNFDVYIDRHNTNSRKWEGMKDMFGRNDLFPMWIADMDFKTPREVIDAIKLRADHGIFGYTFRPGTFYDAIIKWVKKRHGLDIKREWIVDSAGVVSALTIAVLSYTKPGDEVIVQPPVYYPFFRILKNNGREIVNNPLKYAQNFYSMDFDDLEQKIGKRTKMIILCSPHNPVGRVWKKDELEKVGKICAEKGIIIASDEIHSDFVYPSHIHTPVASLGFADHTVTFMAPNKTFNLAGIPSSIAIIPDEKMRIEFENTLENLDVETSNIFSITATEAAYRYGEEWFNALLKYLEGNLNFLRSFINEKMPDVRLVEPEGTYLTWLDFSKSGLSNADLDDLLVNRAGVALDNGKLFGPGGSGFQRMNIAMPRSLLEEGLMKIFKAYSDSKGR